MSSNRLVLQLTFVLVAFAAAKAGPPPRPVNIRHSDDRLRDPNFKHSGDPLRDPNFKHSDNPLRDPNFRHSDNPLRDPNFKHSDNPLRDPNFKHSDDRLRDPNFKHSDNPLRDPNFKHSDDPLRDPNFRHSDNPLRPTESDPSSRCQLQDDCFFYPPPPEIIFRYHTRKFPSGKFFNFLAPPTDFYKSTQTKIITHGMLSSPNSSEIVNLINAYLYANERMNVISLDWSYYTRDMYRDAARSTVEVGHIASGLFCVLYKSFDIYPEQFHFIGHGLGAHLFGVTARDASTSVGRITGLDPARLCFEVYCHEWHFPQLNKNDATFVDVIHTDAGRKGVANTHGTADFYANYGTTQPACHKFTVDNHTEGCDSLTSITYFTETVKNPRAHLAYFCYSAFPSLKCDDKKAVYLGEYVEPSDRGIYNFFTNTSILF